MVGAPSKNNRKYLIKKFLEGMDHNLSEVDFENLSILTFGWSGSDIEVSQALYCNPIISSI
jgi:SpoVK/Ycf46/Vps4 family AAA+-type ATPase